MTDDTDIEPVEYRMTVHLFGAISFVSVCNFVLKHVATIAEDTHGKSVADTIQNNFYVDDCLQSTVNCGVAISLVDNISMYGWRFPSDEIFFQQHMSWHIYHFTNIPRSFKRVVWNTTTSQ